MIQKKTCILKMNGLNMKRSWGNSPVLRNMHSRKSKSFALGERYSKIELNGFQLIYLHVNLYDPNGIF